MTVCIVTGTYMHTVCILYAYVIDSPTLTMIPLAFEDPLWNSKIRCHPSSFSSHKTETNLKMLLFWGREQHERENDGTHHALPPRSCTAMPSLLPKIAQEAETDGRLLMWPSYLNIQFWLHFVLKVFTVVLCTFLVLSKGYAVSFGVFRFYWKAWTFFALRVLKGWEMMLENDFAVHRGCQSDAVSWVGFGGILSPSEGGCVSEWKAEALT